MRVIASTIAAVLLVAGCSSSNESGPPPAPPTSQAPATVEPTTATPPLVEETPGLAAAEVLAAFKAAKLPVRNPRDNSKTCETQQLGCLELITTDDVSIYTFGDAVSMETWAQGFLKEDTFVLRNVVLLYAAARTPAALRPKYQLVLTRLPA